MGSFIARAFLSGKIPPFPDKSRGRRGQELKLNPPLKPPLW